MFNEINEALNEVFLGGRFESRPLYLVLDQRGRALLTERLSTLLYANIDTIEEKCCQAVGASLAKSGDPYQDLEVQLLRWLAHGRKGLPPFTALLFVLSHAAELMVGDGEFSSSNYYQRLADITGVPRGRLSQFGITTAKFWRIFNNWLADTDFSAGRPTARSANTNKYVGLAMSQAIVSEEDRQRFHHLFEKYRFTSTDAITEEEIAQYLGNWIHTTRPTRQLKAAWAKAELRPRICEAAIAELREWSDDSAGGSAKGGEGDTRLSMAISFQHDLLSRTAVLWHGREGELDKVAIDPTADNGACALDNARFASFATVEPRSSIPIDRVLDYGMRLIGAGGRSLKWTARAVIPLVKSEKGNYWTEVNRVTMGVEHIVLVRADNAVRIGVEAALEEIARQGFTLSTYGEINGLPRGWLLYERVKVVKQLEHGAGNGFHLSLSPLGATSGLQVANGLKIGQGIWHEQRPPCLIFDTRQADMRLSVWDGISSDGDNLTSIESNSDEIEIDLAECLPASGNIYAEGSISDVVIGSLTLLLRSAQRPRPLDRQGGGVWRHIDAYRTSISSNGAEAVIGVLAPSLDVEPPNTTTQQFGTLGTFAATAEDPWIPEPTIVETHSNPRAGMSTSEILALPCPIRGLHRYRYETERAGATKRTLLNGECQDCGDTILYTRRTAAVPASGSRPAVPRTAFRAPIETQLPLDLWLDAACFWGSGSLATFEALAGAEGIDGWRAGEALKDFSLLGHCDLGFSKSGRLNAWSVAPPSLAFINKSEAVLCGFRNAQLISDLTELAHSRGAEVKIITQPSQPQLIKVVGLDHGSADDAFDVLEDFHGRGVKIVSKSSKLLADFCRAREGLLSAFAPASIGGHETLQKFDLELLRWQSSNSAREPGAYKISYAGTNYVYVSPSGQAYRASYELVKLAAARMAGIKLHAYDPSTRVFSSVLGCEPAGLPGRALVSSSGILPRVENGISMFVEVPPEVAISVLEFLYTGALPT